MSKTAKFTPGPWAITDEYGHPDAVTLRLRVATVCEVPSRVGICQVFASGVGAPREQQMANAHLITAAPDLLAACEAVLPILERIDALRHLSDQGFAELDLLRAAIAKATGNPV
jgi:hypothetical protein